MHKNFGIVALIALGGAEAFAPGATAPALRARAAPAVCALSASAADAGVTRRARRFHAASRLGLADGSRRAALGRGSAGRRARQRMLPTITGRRQTIDDQELKRGDTHSDALRRLATRSALPIH